MNQDSATIRQEIIDLKKQIEAEGNCYEDRYFPLLTELLRTVVRLFESYGITQICIPSSKDGGCHSFFRIRDKDEEYEVWPIPEFYSEASRECCMSAGLKWSYTEEEVPDYDGFSDFDEDMMALFEIDDAMKIVHTIDRYKELGIPRSEWHKPLDLSKYTDKTTPTA